MGLDSSGNSRPEQHSYIGIEKQSGSSSIIYNSVKLAGNNVVNTGTVSTFAFNRLTTGVDSIMNNIFINERSNSSFSGGSHYAISINDSSTLVSRRNLFFATGNNGLLGISGNNPYSSLSAWQVGTKLDTLSVSKAVTFVSFNDLHLAGASIGDADLVATPIAAYPRDIDNNLRQPMFPYLGCDENTSTPLPVNLITFTAEVVVNDVVLNWITSSEINNYGFYVERSVNGKEFEDINFIKGRLNSSVFVKYSDIDANPFGSNTKLYYRLRQVDMSGEYAYSPTVVAKKLSHNLHSVSVFPNPVAGVLSIEFVKTNSGITSIQIFDINGRNVSQKDFQCKAGLNILTIEETTHLNAGVYFVKIESVGETQIVKLIKQ